LNVAKSAKHGLGRGIDALIPLDERDDLVEMEVEKVETPPHNQTENAVESENHEKNEEIYISLEKIKPDPNQPRKSFDDGELAELAETIKEEGIIQPIIATSNDDGTYTIVSGERRYRAAKLAGLEKAPVLVRDYSEEKRRIVARIENVPRADLNPIDEAAGYKQLIEMTGLSQEEVAARVGKNRSTVANSLRLLQLPFEMQESLQMGDITPGHARAILSVPDFKDQETLFAEILKKGLSVREAEHRAGAFAGLNKRTRKPKQEEEPAKRAPELDAMEEKFRFHLGTKVKIDGDMNGGRVMIDYYSMEDLERVYEILSGTQSA
jgi:ParB family chromosome partitioning protein